MEGTSAWTVTRDGFTVRFLYGQGDDPDAVDNLDAWIHFADGTVRYGTFMTPAAISEVLRRWRATGEVGGGRYFWSSDLVIVPSPGVRSMVAAVEEMVRSGDIEVICAEAERLEP